MKPLQTYICEDFKISHNTNIPKHRISKLPPDEFEIDTWYYNEVFKNNTPVNYYLIIAKSKTSPISSRAKIVHHWYLISWDNVLTNEYIDKFIENKKKELFGCEILYDPYAQKTMLLKDLFEFEDDTIKKAKQNNSPLITLFIDCSSQKTKYVMNA